MSNPKGMTLIELLVAIVLLSLVLVVFSSAYVNGLKVYKRESRRSNLQNENRIVLDRIILDIKQASSVDDVSTAQSLTLEIPAIDLNEDILYEAMGAFKTDSYTYSLEAGKIRKTVAPHLDSSREVSDKYILDNVSGVTFTYLPDVSSADEVEVNLISQDNYGDESIIVNNKSRAKLRNK